MLPSHMPCEIRIGWIAFFNRQRLADGFPVSRADSQCRQDNNIAFRFSVGFRFARSILRPLQLRRDRATNSRGDLIPAAEDVVEGSFETLCPDMLPVSRRSASR